MGYRLLMDEVPAELAAETPPNNGETLAEHAHRLAGMGKAVVLTAADAKDIAVFKARHAAAEQRDLPLIQLSRTVEEATQRDPNRAVPLLDDEQRAEAKEQALRNARFRARPASERLAYHQADALKQILGNQSAAMERDSDATGEK